MILTGGGSAGHVTVNLALIPKLREQGWQMRYIGSENGIEKELLNGVDDVKYYAISTGKLRRYFDWKNFKDPFNVMKGVYQAYRIIKKEKPQLVFSKGGFVSVPVIIGAWLNNVPTIIHESDFTPGLANKLSVPFATKVCTTFPETIQFLPKEKTVSVGAIIREELKSGNPQNGYHFCDFVKSKPVILVMGGSLGAKRINEAVRNNLDPLLKDFQIVHLCGKGHADLSINARGYQQYEYIKEELPDILAMTDLVISRAGANAIHEFLALKKPMILIPLSRKASRGDQILNAESFEKAGYAEVIPEEDLTDSLLLDKINKVHENRRNYIDNMVEAESESPLKKLLNLIQEI